jgi:hypothetical protein
MKITVCTRKILFWSHLTGSAIPQSRNCSINNSLEKVHAALSTDQVNSVQKNNIQFEELLKSKQCQGQCLKQAQSSTLLSTNTHLKFVLGL